MNATDSDRVAADQHDRWCRRLLDSGITTRASPQGDGEELLAPWSHLSAWAQDYNRAGLRDTLQALAEAGYVVVPRADLLRAQRALDDMTKDAAEPTG